MTRLRRELNHLLWLKGRLSIRAQQTSSSSGFGTILLLAFTFATFIPAAIALGAFVYAAPESRQEEILGVSLTAMYLLWVTFPISGYKLNEFMDMSRLQIFPISPERLFLAGVMASFIDPPAFLFYPFLAVCLFLHAAGPVQAVLCAGGLLAFMVHTFGLGQLILSILTNILNMRRFSEIIIILLPILALVMVLAFETAYLLASSSLSEFTQVPVPILVGFFPSGVLTRFLLAVKAGETDVIFFQGTLLLLLAGLTIVVGARVTDVFLRQTGPLEWARRQGARLSRRVRRLWFWPAAADPRSRSNRALPLIRIGKISRRLCALIIKEWLLMIREPQVRMATGVYVVVTGLMLWVTQGDGAPPAGRGLMMALGLGSVGLNAGVLLNSLALERDGIKFLISAPTSIRDAMIGKNFAQWSLMGGFSLLIVLTAGLALDVTGKSVALVITATMFFLVSLSGLGNLASVLVPIKLPAKGVHPQSNPSAGTVFLMILVGGFLSALATIVSGLAVAMLIVPGSLYGSSAAAAAAPFSFSLVLGTWCGATGLASWLFEKRRESLIRTLCS